MATNTCIRWGICSAGKICHDFVSAIRTLPHAEHKVVAVAARDLTRAQEFAKLHQITHAYGSYEELAKNTDVDVIYIGTATHEHCRLTQLMLNHGKPVLCEKPLGSNLKEVQAMISLAKEKKLFLMEGFWTRFFPAAIKLQEDITNGSIGDVRLVDTRAFINLSECPEEKFSSPSLSGGSMMLLGCYGIQYCSMIYGEKPTHVSASGHLYDTGTDKLAIVTLKYSNGRAAVIKTALEVTCTPTNSVTVYGSKGSMKIGPVQWCPVELKTPTETLNFPTPEPAVKGKNPYAGGFQYQAEAVRQCLIKGELESSTMPHEHSLWNMEILDEIRRQLGVHFPADD